MRCGPRHAILLTAAFFLARPKPVAQPSASDPACHARGQPGPCTARPRCSLRASPRRPQERVVFLNTEAASPSPPSHASIQSGTMPAGESAFWRQGQAQPRHAHDQRRLGADNDRHWLLRRQFIRHGSAQDRIQVDRVSPALAGRQGRRLPYPYQTDAGLPLTSKSKQSGASFCRPSRLSPNTPYIYHQASLNTT